MANRFPLVIDTTDGNKLKELPAGDNLDLRESSIVRVQNVDALGTINAADITVNGNRLVAQNFIDLTDTPEDYVDAADKFVKVNATGDGLEFRPFSDIGNIEVEEIEVATQIVPATTGTVNIGTDELYFDRVVANEFKGDLISGTDERVFNAATGKISYAALEGAPTQISEFENDIGYLLAADLDASLAGLFDEGATFATDITGSVFGDDSTTLVDGTSSLIVGNVENTSVITVNLTTTTSTATTSIADEFRGASANDTVINAQNDYDIRIGESNTGNTIIFNGEADSFSFETGVGIAEYSASTDLILRAGNRIRFADTPVRFSQLTDTQAGYVVAQNGDVIYNTTQNRLQIRQNNAWVDLHKGQFDGNVITATGTSEFNNVEIAGNLTVSGTTTTVDTENTTISDNVIILNNGETGAGVTNTTSGIEIDRGSESNKTLVWDDSVDKWTIGAETFVAATFEGNLTGDVTAEDVQINGATSRLTFDSLTAPEIRNGDGSVRVVLFGDDYSPGTAQLYVEANDVWLYSTLNVEQSAFIKGDVTAAAFKGTFVGDDSAVLVDGVAGKIVGNVDTNLIETSIVTSQGGNFNPTGQTLGIGAANGSATGGTVIVGGGTGTAGDGGTASLGGGTGSAGNGGMASVSGGTGSVNGGAAYLVGGTGSGGNGGAAYLVGGTGSGNGGGVTVVGGPGSVTDGVVDIGTEATSAINIGAAGATTTTIDGTFNATLTGDVVGDVTGDIDNTTLTIGATDATSITIGNSGSTTTVEGTIQFTNALIANNLTADDSITITTDGNTVGEAISIGPGGSNTFVNLTATNIRFFGDITTSINATAGIVGDIKGSVVADDSTILVDAVNGVIPKANVESSTNWDTAFSWGNHATQGYLTSIPSSIAGDLKGSVFADDSSVMVNAVDFTMATDIMTLTPLNAPPADPISGMLAAADGTNWDPASKSGVVSYPVFYDGAAWNALY
jgi:hypothetical protein